MLTVTVASTDRDLTTTAALKAEAFGATATSTVYDARLSNQIRRGSMAAETYIGYPLHVATYRETVAGFGRRRLMLSRHPLRSIKAIYDATSTDDANQILSSEIIVEDREAGFLARNEGFTWSAPMQWRANGLAAGDSIPLDPGPMSGQEYKPWLIDYVAGYTYAGIDTGSANWSTELGTTSTGRTMPEDIELAVLLRSQETFEQTSDVSSESLGDISVSYRSGSTGGGGGSAPTEWQAILEPYRRWV